jgi:hypothetical protein
MPKIILTPRRIENKVKAFFFLLTPRSQINSLEIKNKALNCMYESPLTNFDSSLQYNAYSLQSHDINPNICSQVVKKRPVPKVQSGGKA